jgi:thiamine-phosphate pyrophosphorylase
MLPRLYAIVDAGVLAVRDVSVEDYASGLRAAGVVLLQYRDKTGSPQEVLRGAAALREALAGSGATLVMNDRADLAVLAEFDGVHVGHLDLSPDDAKRVIGSGRIVGVSTHTEDQVRAAELSCADYIAFGPVFSTGTKLDTEPVMGLDGLRRARALTTKPLVAIGGITRSNARSVIDAGADSVAIISGLVVPGEPAGKVARDFLELLR